MEKDCFTSREIYIFCYFSAKFISFLYLHGIFGPQILKLLACYQQWTCASMGIIIAKSQKIEKQDRFHNWTSSAQVIDVWSYLQLSHGAESVTNQNMSASFFLRYSSYYSNMVQCFVVDIGHPGVIYRPGKSRARRLVKTVNQRYRAYGAA